MSGCDTRITRREMEVSTGWAKANPDLFVKAMRDFTDEAINDDLYDVRVDIDRVGFYVFTAQAQKS